MQSNVLTFNQKKIINEALEIERESAIDAGKIAYMARALTLATIPHRDPKTNQFIRKNGSLTVTITDVYGNGLPFGSYPRLLLAWLTTEAVLTKSPTIELGSSLASFMHQLGLGNSGGKRGVIKGFKQQTLKLFSSTISCLDERNNHQQGQAILIADDFDIWWHPTVAEQNSIHASTVTLSDRFFNQIIESPVPIDYRALTALKRSPMALDIYMWLTYRMSYLGRDTAIPWEQMQMQLGAGYDFSERGRKNFQQAFTKHLKAVLVVYPKARVSTARGRLILKPSPTHIAKSVR